MDFLYFDPQNIGTWYYRVKNHIFLSQHHQTHRTFRIRWYKTPLRLKPKSWKLVTQWHGNARVSHMDLLDFDPHRIGKWNYRVKHHIWLSQHHKNQIKPLIQIWYEIPWRLKPKSWKLVIQCHGNARFSHMSLLDLYPNRIWKWN